MVKPLQLAYAPLLFHPKTFRCPKAKPIEALGFIFYFIFFFFSFPFLWGGSMQVGMLDINLTRGTYHIRTSAVLFTNLTTRFPAL